jgi:hypothetical protein
MTISLRPLIGAFFGVLFGALGLLAIVGQETVSFHRYINYWRGLPAIVMGIGWLGLSVASVSWLCIPQRLRFARIQDVGAYGGLFVFAICVLVVPMVYGYLFARGG